MKNKKSIIFGVLASVFLAAGLFVGKVFADSYSTGGQGAEGSSGGSASVNCTTTTHDRCNRWIRVSKSTFQDLWSSGHVIGDGYSQDAYNICMSTKNKDGYIIIAGQIKSKKFNTLTLWNLYPKPSYLSYNYKTHWAESYAYDYESGTFGGISSWSMGEDTRSYGELLSALATNYGVSAAEIAFFCQGMDEPSGGEPDPTPETYYTQSNASVRSAATATGSSDYQATNIMTGTDNPSSRTVTAAKTITLPNAGGSATARITFSHNIYSDTANTSRGWTVTRDVSGTVNANGFNANGFSNRSGYYTISDSSSVNSSNGRSHTSSGTATIGSNNSSGYYISESRPYSDGTNLYTLRDTFEVTFYAAGTYTFCETFQDNPLTAFTKSCNRITVNPPPSSVCPVSSFSPTTGTIHSGTTSAISAVRNESVSGYSSWSITSSNPILAKPTDEISFVHCYSPGSTTVKKSSGTHDTSDPGWDNRDCGHDNPCPDITVTRTIGEQDTYVETENRFTVVNDGNLTTIIGTPSFNITSPFSAVSRYVFSNTVGDASMGVATTTSNVVRTGYASQTIGEHVHSNNMGTSSSEASHSGHSWFHTGYYQTYDCTSCCSGGTAENPCSPGYSWVNHTSNYHSYIVEQNSYSNNTWYVGTHAPGGVGNTARVYIPYNYITEIATQVGNQSSGIVYAGESISTNTNIRIRTRWNSSTEGEYSTETPSGIEVRMISFTLPYGTNLSVSATLGTVTSNATQAALTGAGYSGADPCNYFSSRFSGFGNCRQVATTTGQWNSSGNYYGWSRNNVLQTSASIPDVADGTLFCVASAIHTANSGTNENNYDGTVNRNWNISPMVCRTVTKKPNFQILGGSAFINGEVHTSIARKTDISRVFVSSDEFALISTNNAVLNTFQGMASGNVMRALSNGYVGSIGDTNAICDLSPLSIANNVCSSYKHAGYSNVNINNSLLDSLLSRFKVDSSRDSTYSLRNQNAINLATDYTASDASSPDLHGYRYTYADGDIHITQAPEEITGVTHIIYSNNGNIYLDTNIKYNDAPMRTDGGSGYSEAGDVPQYIIIARSGSIYINASVDRVDALLIAQGSGSRGEINTCYNYGIPDLNSNSHCNTQLKINGAVFAKKLVLNRTYGAGTGSDSKTPAEIINFSPATALWAYSQARDYPQAFTTYIRELAPRY